MSPTSGARWALASLVCSNTTSLSQVWGVQVAHYCEPPGVFAAVLRFSWGALPGDGLCWDPRFGSCIPCASGSTVHVD